MPRLSFLPTLVRERLTFAPRPREPEPDLVMADTAQVESYTHAGRIDGVMSASYLFHSAAISATIRGCREVIDLACGPATQLAQVASLNPQIQFHGIDLSSTMLDSARRHIEALGLTNVRFSQCDITKIDFVPDASVDGLISTMALHHLPTIEDLDACFAEIARVVKPGGAIYLVDFGRLRSLKSIKFFAYMNADAQPPIFSLDYENSLRAAFALEDFRRLAAKRLPANVAVHSTFIVPMLTVLKTPALALEPASKARIGAMRQALPRRYRADLDDMRLFFRLNGFSTGAF